MYMLFYMPVVKIKMFVKINCLGIKLKLLVWCSKFQPILKQLQKPSKMIKMSKLIGERPLMTSLIRVGRGVQNSSKKGTL